MSIRSTNRRYYLKEIECHSLTIDNAIVKFIGQFSPIIVKNFIVKNLSVKLPNNISKIFQYLQKINNKKIKKKYNKKIKMEKFESIISKKFLITFFYIICKKFIQNHFIVKYCEIKNEKYYKYNYRCYKYKYKCYR